MQEPKTFGKNPCNLENYKCDRISDTQILVTFTGCRFGRARKTQYLFHFLISLKCTEIVLEFKHELFGFPLPYTSIFLIDEFMREKIQAYRVDE